MNLLLWLAAAHAADTWSTPYTGVRLLERTASTPWQIHAAEVDLCERGVSVRATTEAEHKRTTSSFVSATSVEVATNGDFFSYTDYYPIGLAVGEGTAWNADNSTMGFVAFGADKAELSEPTEVVSTLESWTRQAVGGYPLLVKEGAALTSFSPAPSHCPDRHPRTAVGLSEDRQTLWMVVVDGRSTATVGMTCAELADLMADLGAHTALNLDGGGSSTLVVRGKGTINDPSDGSERTVANHLGVHADGSGAPGSCDFWMNEVIVDAATYDDGGSTDVDGDGTADLCARGAAGLRCYPSGASGFGSPWTTSLLADASGWADETNYATLRFADVTGDGLADTCARADDRVYCWPSTGSGFGDAIAGPELADSVGWGGIGYWSTLRFADLDGDGRDDACARAAAGFGCYLSTGSGFGGRIAGPEWSDASGWKQPHYYGTIRMGDVDGDGRADACARASAGMRCALSTGSGFGATFAGPEWTNAAGWDDVKHWGTIRLVDVDGDGRDDLCGRDPDGIVCHLSTGSGFGDAIRGPALSDASGWGDHDNASTIRWGDLDADGDQDVCARANAGIRCWTWEGGGFSGTSIVGPALDDASGWNDHRLYASLRLADVDGDGDADLCGRGTDGVTCWRSDGAGFGDGFAGPTLTDGSGWSKVQYATTLRLAGPPPRPEPVDTGDTDRADTDATDTARDTDRRDSADTAADSDVGGRRVPGQEGCSCRTGGAIGAWPLLLAFAVRRRRR